MEKKFVLLSLLLISSVAILAQDNLLPIYQISSDTVTKQRLDESYYQRLEDKDGKWTFDEVSKRPLVNEFRKEEVNLKGTDTSAATSWLRYKLKNVMSKEVKIFLDTDGNEIDFYVLEGANQVSHYRTGSFVPWSKRDGNKNAGAVPIILSPGKETVIYCRIYNSITDIPVTREINLETEKFIEKETYNLESSEIQHSFFNGLFLLAGLFNFFFFYISRERVYLYLALFLISVSCTTNSGLFLILREHPLIFRSVSSFFVITWPFFLMYFLRYYFQTFRYVSRWDKVLIIITFAYVTCKGIQLYSFILPKYITTPAEILIRLVLVGWYVPLLIFVLAFVITPFLFLKRQKMSFRSFMTALVPLFLHFVIIVFILLAYSVSDKIIFAWLLEWIAPLFDYTTLWAVLNFSWLLFKRYDQQKKEISEQALHVERLGHEKEIQRSELIAKQKVELEKEVEQRTAELKQTLANLKSAQSQLVQSEKMASLGELTAGIAHEIQNPLNFINNFSEVNKELVSEMKGEIDSGNFDEVKAIAGDIEDNEEKINHHGKRADAIVKGMLQHSRASAGKKEPTDINALADEYLRLSYHGLRAKDKSFNATIETHFDEGIGKIEVIPQDIGRVLLNLFNNAFYAVNEKKKHLNGSFEPSVSVRTKSEGDKVIIVVRDNGTGIPQKAVDKIFQPFFTTKPTGQGTGLGLSLSYDIIKAHGGEIKVETEKDEGAEFIITL